MKAVKVVPDGSSPQLIWDDVPDISFGEDEVLVDVRATAVNRADLLQARGLYPPPPGETEILGLEISGRIAQAGPRVTGWQVGSPVMALLPGGGYAQKAAVHHRMLMPLPRGWSFEQGAAVPEVWLTAYVNLFTEGRLAAGETVLIHAGASGVGTAAIQLAVASGARVLATAGSDLKTAACRKYGAELAVNYKKSDFAAAIESRARGVDLILDPVGASYLEKNLTVLRENGRLVNIGLMGGASTAVDLGKILGKSLRIIGSRLRPRPLAEKIRITADFRERFWPLLSAGRLEPVVDSIFPIEQVRSAHDHVRANRNIGKVILAVKSDD